MTNKKLNRAERYEITMRYIDKHSTFIMDKLKSPFSDKDIIEYEDASLGFGETDKNRKLPFSELLRKFLLWQASKAEVEALYNYLETNDKNPKAANVTSADILKEMAENDKSGVPKAVSVFDDYQNYINNTFTQSGERIIKAEFENIENENQKIR